MQEQTNEKVFTDAAATAAVTIEGKGGMDVTNVTNIISPEATEDVIIKRPSFSKEALISSEYYEKMTEEIDKMNFIEVSRVLRELITEIANLKQAKEMLNNIEVMGLDSKTNKAVQEANVMADLGVNAEVESFKASYEEDLLKLELLSEKAETRVRFFDNVEKTTAYLTDTMLDIINQKIETSHALNKAENAPILIYYRTMRDVFTNRNQTDYFVTKISSMKENIARMKREIKNGKVSSDFFKKYVTDILVTEFSIDQLRVFEKFVDELFKNDDAVQYFLYTLANIYTNTKNFKKTGEHKWVEVLIMNVLDIIVGSYDLEGGAEAYSTNLLKIKTALGY